MIEFMVFGERTKNFSARLIHVGMFLYRLTHPRTWRHSKPVYNHWGIIIRGFVYEMVSNELKISTRTLYKKHCLWKVTTDNPDVLTTLAALKGYNPKYEYSNFLFHTLLIIFPKWLGSRDTKRMSCIEFVTRILQVIDKKINLWLNPLWIKAYMDNNYERAN